LQELEEDGIVDDSLCSEITFPGGTSLLCSPLEQGLMEPTNIFFTS